MSLLEAQTDPASGAPDLPRISIIVPTYERPRRLARCIAAIARLSYPRDRFELIVVDDGGESPLHEVIEAHRGDCRVHLLRVVHAGPAAARNAGADAALHPWLAFTDDDCEPRPDWLERLAPRLTQGSGVAGRVVNGLTANPYSATTQSIVDFLSDRLNRDPAQATFGTTSNLVLEARGFREIGGFDTTFVRPGGEDRELCDRWIDSGYTLQFAAEAIVDHYHDMDLRGFWRQHFHYGRGSYAFRQTRARRIGRPVGLESQSFYLDLLRLPIHHHGWKLGPVGLMLLTQVANAAGFLSMLVRTRIARRGR